MRVGIASRPAPDMNVNGDAHIIKEWNGQALLAVIDGLGHGPEAAAASEKARGCIDENFARGIQDLHPRLRDTRGVAAGLARINRSSSSLAYCGVGNIDVRVIGEPEMHPTSMEGILGMNMRRIRRFEYQYNSLRGLVMYSDGISGKFDLSAYPGLYSHPEQVAQQILAEWGRQHDDATIIIAVEDAE
jgi:hypothetical protein